MKSVLAKVASSKLKSKNTNLQYSTDYNTIWKLESDIVNKEDKNKKNAHLLRKKEFKERIQSLQSLTK